MLSIKIIVYLTSLLLTSLMMGGWFLNQEQQAVYLFEQGRYAEAAEYFPDPFRQGVAWYRAGEYERAADAFSQVENPQLKEKARYNLGNAYFQQQQFEKAIDAYQQALQVNPNHQDAQHNLNLAKYYLQKPSPSQLAQSENNGKLNDNGQQSDGFEEKQVRETNQQLVENGKRDHSSNSQSQNQPQPGYQASQTPSQSGQFEEFSSSSEQRTGSERQQLASFQEAKNVEENGQPNADKQADEESKQQVVVAKNGENGENGENNAENKSSKEPIVITDLPSPSQQENAEREGMANVLLGRIEGDPEILLKRQFYIDNERQYRRQNFPQSEQNW